MSKKKKSAPQNSQGDVEFGHKRLGQKSQAFYVTGIKFVCLYRNKFILRPYFLGWVEATHMVSNHSDILLYKSM